MRFLRFLSFTAFAALFALTTKADAQATVLTGLLSNATVLNFYWTVAGAPRPEAKPEGKYGANGLGFELAFEIPGGTSHDRVRPTPQTMPTDSSCESRFIRREIEPPARCEDIKIKAVKRTYARGDSSFEQELEIKRFAWSEPVWQLDIGIGFAQTGAYVSRNRGTDFRVSVREAPSVSAYASYAPDPQIFRALPIKPRPYVGIRTGLISLNGGRAYTPTGANQFGGETFQMGGVAGLIAKVKGIAFFLEGAYMWRDFKSLEWGATVPPGSPHRLNLSGGSLATGIQFSLKPSPGK